MSVKSTFERLKRFVVLEMWAHELREFRGPRKFFYKLLRVLILALHEFSQSQCALRAAALTLIFVFSLAPAMAVGFSVAKGFGVHDQIRPMVYKWVAAFSDDELSVMDETNPLIRIFNSVMDYIEKTNVKTLGFLGFVVILYAAYAVLRSIEKTMNQIWGVKRQRTFMRQVTDYLAVLFMLPLMLTLATAALAAVKTPEVQRAAQQYLPAAGFLAIAVAAVLTVAGFWFLYCFFPYTRVPLYSGAIGAVIAGISWAVLQYLFIKLQMGVNKYNAIYGALAAVPIFLLWLQLSWSIVLFGAEISFAHANQAELEYGGLTFTPSVDYQERLAVGIMALVGKAFEEERPALTAKDLSHALAAPIRTVRKVLNDLTAARLLIEFTSNGQSAFDPAAPVENVTVGRIIGAVANVGQMPDKSQEALSKLGVESLVEQPQMAGRTGLTLAEVIKNAERKT